MKQKPIKKKPKPKTKPKPEVVIWINKGESIEEPVKNN